MTHSSDHHSECCAPELGALLMQFELGTLSPEQRSAFEKHLMDCDFCLHEAAQMRQLADSLRANRQEIVSAFASEGISINSLLELETNKPKLKPLDIRGELSKPRLFSWESLFGPKAALAFAAAAAFLLVIGLGIFRGDRPAAVGEYEPPAWYGWQSRGQEAPDSILLRAREYYVRQDFEASARDLSAYLSLREDAQAALYLAVCYYQTKKFDLAAKALGRVDSTNRIVFEEAEFYRALILLQQGEQKSAAKILETLVSTQSARADEARDLMKRLE